ncbi:MAG: nucleotide exchange factor GrpE [Patescibacteria group bacterium]
MSENQKIAELQEEVAKLKEALTLAEGQSQEHLAGWQRARADYSNFKREQEKRQQEVVEFANAVTLAEILPVYSHFKLALKHIPQEQKKEAWVEGIIQIGKQFIDFLKKFKIEEIKTIGEKFNHEFHEAVVHEEKNGFESDVIFEEVSPGYLLAGKVLQPAKVKVAK